MIKIPRSEEENQRIRKAQRTRILEAAKEVFARKGWSITIADIASAAKVSQGLIYHYFANKEAIFNELIEQTVKSDLNVSQKVPGDTPTQRLEAFISSVLITRHELVEKFGITAQMAKENSPTGNNLEIMRRMFQNLQNSDLDAKDFQDLMMKRFESVFDIIMQLIVEGQKSGEFSQDAPSKLAMMIFTCIQSLTTLAVNQPDEYEKHYPYTEIIMRMLRSNN